MTTRDQITALRGTKREPFVRGATAELLSAAERADDLLTLEEEDGEFIDRPEALRVIQRLREAIAQCYVGSR